MGCMTRSFGGWDAIDDPNDARLDRDGQWHDEPARGMECQECGRIVPGKPGTGGVCRDCVLSAAEREQQRRSSQGGPVGPKCDRCGRIESVPWQRAPYICDDCLDQLRRAPQSTPPREVEHELVRDHRDGPPADAQPWRLAQWADDERQEVLPVDTPGPDVGARNEPRGRAHFGFDRDGRLFGAMRAEADSTLAPATLEDGTARGLEADIEPLTDAGEGEWPIGIDIDIEQEGAGVLEPEPPAGMGRAGVHAEVAERLIDDGDRDVIEREERAMFAEGGAGVGGIGRVEMAVGSAEGTAAVASQSDDSAKRPAAGLGTRHESRLASLTAGRHGGICGPCREDYHRFCTGKLRHPVFRCRCVCRVLTPSAQPCAGACDHVGCILAHEEE